MMRGGYLRLDGSMPLLLIAAVAASDEKKCDQPPRGFNFFRTGDDRRVYCPVLDSRRKRSGKFDARHVQDLADGLNRKLHSDTGDHGDGVRSATGDIYVELVEMPSWRRTSANPEAALPCTGPSSRAVVSPSG